VKSVVGHLTALSGVLPTVAVAGFDKGNGHAITKLAGTHGQKEDSGGLVVGIPLPHLECHLLSWYGDLNIPKFEGYCLREKVSFRNLKTQTNM